jgi:hypothetical protein
MTVAELINILQTLDPTEEVRVAYPYVYGHGMTTAPLEDVILEGPAGGIPTLIAQF